MDEMFTRVETTTTLPAHIAKAAIGYVLMFLRDEFPSGRVAEFIDKSPRALEFVAAAQARSDAGVTEFVEGMTSFMGHGRWDFNVLAGRLANLGLTEAQTDTLLREVLSRAAVLIDEADIATMRDELPLLRQRTAPYDELERRRAV